MMSSPAAAPSCLAEPVWMASEGRSPRLAFNRVLAIVRSGLRTGRRGGDDHWQTRAGGADFALWT